MSPTIITISKVAFDIEASLSFLHHGPRIRFPGQQVLEDSNEYPTSQESSKRIVLEPPLIKRGKSRIQSNMLRIQLTCDHP